MPLLVFFMLAMVSIASSVMMVKVKNAVHSALFLILTFFCIAGIFLLLNAELIAGFQIFLYAGAVMVMFLFVIMLLNLTYINEQRTRHTQDKISYIVSFLFFCQLVVLTAGNFYYGTPGSWTLQRMQEVGGNTEAVGLELYTKYLFPFEVASIVLLVAMIGAIVLPSRRRRRRDDTREGRFL